MKRLIWIAVAALLAGCPAQPRRAVLVQSWEASRAELQQRDRFDLKARVAVAAGQEGFNARMRWQQQGTQTQLALDGPLGVGGAQVEFDGQTLDVHTSRGQHLSDAAARAELLARLGFEPPFESLRYWIQGVPDPATAAEETLDEQQRLATLQQEGWQIEYADYEVVDGRWLPKRLTLHREGVRVRLLVDDWGAR